MDITVTGTILVINDTNVVSDKFKKREFVLEVPDGNYPQKLLIETINDRTNLLDKYHVGDELTAHINLRGRSFEKKDGSTGYFNSIECWKAEGTPANAPLAPEYTPFEPVAPEEDSDTSDLPF